MRRAENLVIKFSPPEPKRELILSAHYDSKTELLDHHQRMFFLKNLRLGNCDHVRFGCYEAAGKLVTGSGLRLGSDHL